MKAMPRYPIYVPSKGRSHIDKTTAFLISDGVPFNLVVEPQDEPDYRKKFGGNPLVTILVLPENNRGLIVTRNWILERSRKAGDERHWQIDDNIQSVMRHFNGRRLPCDSAIAIAACEDFCDRYENVAIAGLNYVMFAVEVKKPFVLNAHVYSFTLILNRIPYNFRQPANEDVDMCLQVLAGGWCTIQFNAFLCQKIATMIIKGGQTDAAYRGDGRLFMARALERKWPGVVTTDRRFGRPQHVVAYQWRKFDNQLKLKPGIDLSKLNENEYGMTLKAVKEVQSEDLKALVEKTSKKGKKAHAKKNSDRVV